MADTGALESSSSGLPAYAVGNAGAVADASVGSISDSVTLMGLGALVLENSDADILRPKGNLIFFNNPSLNIVNIGPAKDPARVLINISNLGKALGGTTALTGVALEVFDTVGEIRSRPQDAQSLIIDATMDVEAGLALGLWPVGTIIGGAHLVGKRIGIQDDVRTNMLLRHNFVTFPRGPNQ